MKKPFKRIAIINRGEAAMRFIHAVREYNEEHQSPLRTIALYTEPDSRSLFVREADHAHLIGPAEVWDQSAGKFQNSYMDYDRIAEVLRHVHADAVWVGWGFVSEHAAFAAMCEKMKIVFIGPGSETLRLLGDKIESKKRVESAGIPVIPWSGGKISTLASAKKAAAKLGYPVIIKPVEGGGGHGIHLIHDDTELEEAWPTARSESRASTGEASFFLEKRINRARHVEVQILADAKGTVWPVGVRDCTLQRQNRKLMEEAPSPVLNPEQTSRLLEAAAKIGKLTAYRNAGTVEFLFDPSTSAFYFMEVNARLQIEHPVTEMTTGLDLVKMQLHIAGGGLLTGAPPPTCGHSIEVRLNAEDPANGFTPAPGIVDIFSPATGPGIRIDTGVSEGDSIPAEFDGLIAKIVAFGKDRAEAMARLRRALVESTIVIRGSVNNKGFLLDMLERPEVRDSAFDTGWLDRMIRLKEHLSRKHAAIALMQGAVEAYLAEIKIEKEKFFASAQRGRPEVIENTGQQVELTYENTIYQFKVLRLGVTEFRLETDGHSIHLQTESVRPNLWNLTVARKKYRVLSLAQDHTYLIEVNGSAHQVKRYEGGIVRSPAPAVVSSIAVHQGDIVKKGDRLLVLEAMKMEMAVTAEYDGTISGIPVRNNMQVDTGMPLILIDPKEDKEADQKAFHLDFSPYARNTSGTPALSHRCESNMRAIARTFRGFDVDPAYLKALLDRQAEICFEIPADDPDLWNWEDDILNIFANLIAIFKREPFDEGEEADSRLSAQEYLFTFISELRSGKKNLPAGFMENLRKAAALYGIRDLEPGDQLEMGLFRIFKSFKRMPKQIPAVLNILDRRLENAPALTAFRTEPFRKLLDRIVAESHGRFPQIHAMALEVRYSFFDKPFLKQARERIYAKADADLLYLAESPTGKERESRIARLVACPQALRGRLSEMFYDAGENMQMSIQEVLTRRYYRIRSLKNIQHPEPELLSASYELDGRKFTLITSHCQENGFEKALKAMIRHAETIPEGPSLLFDVYVRAVGMDPNSDTQMEAYRQILDRTIPTDRVRRVVVSVSGTQNEKPCGRIFTFYKKEDGFLEERIYRDMHPMMGKRLELWRLKNFEIERLPSVEDVYLFRCKSHENPRDIRLFAFAEVRDLSLLGPENGNGSSARIPYLEMMLSESFSMMRRYLTKLPSRERPYWNRVMLYIWPEIKGGFDEIHGLIRNVAPSSQGLGLEKIIFRARQKKNGKTRETILDVRNPASEGRLIRMRKPQLRPIRSLTPYAQKVVRLQRRGLVYPYEIIHMLTPKNRNTQSEFPAGEFIEFDLNERHEAVRTDRPYGMNTANIVFGQIRNYTEKYPEGMVRVALLGDPSRGMGNLAEAECRRIIAGIDMAERLRVPVEWFAVSAGARISMDSGTENMDWIARVLRRIIRFTQAGGEVNIIVNGINVGAQPYWNAEATMLMHTRGILIMQPNVSMVLTGKQALDYSGGVSADDNEGIGGYDRIMGPNGQAQYFARNLSEACHILLKYYNHSYIFPGDRFPRKAITSDPINRDVRIFPHGGDMEWVGDIFSDETNQGRKRPFDIRKVMSATIDQDQGSLERWFGMQDAEIAVVWDAHIGGYPVCMIGIESRPIPRIGFVPADGPESWTGGTLFPRASKKIARAVNAASGNRPLVVLANLSGFDGSPESLRNWQLEFGAEIGRSMVNFKGPIVMCVVSRYHGGAFVVFSNKLNDNMEVAAIEGTFASVIGGAPAAAVVFAGEVSKRTAADPRLLEMETRINEAKGAAKARLRTDWTELNHAVYSEKLGEVAGEFDRIHNINRAQQVGSVDHIIPAANMRPFLIEAIERGLAKASALE